MEIEYIRIKRVNLEIEKAYATGLDAICILLIPPVGSYLKKSKERYERENKNQLPLNFYRPLYLLYTRTGNLLCHYGKLFISVCVYLYIKSIDKKQLYVTKHISKPIVFQLFCYLCDKTLTYYDYHSIY